MLTNYLIFLVLYFPYFIIHELPIKFLHFYKNAILYLDSILGFRLNLYLFLVPVYGRYEFILRLTSIFYRIFMVITSLIFMAIFTIISFASYILILGLPVILFSHSLSKIFLAILVYFSVYLFYFLINPIKGLKDITQSVNQLELFKMSDFTGRVYLSSPTKPQKYNQVLYSLGQFLELEVNELAQIIQQIENNLKTYPYGEIITLAQKSNYRFLNQNVLACGMLNSSKDFHDYLENKNLPSNCLETYLKTIHNNFTFNKPVIWDFDFVPELDFGYNASRIDPASPTLNTYALPFDPKDKKLVLNLIPSFNKYSQEVKNSLSGGNRKILILGNPGTGKTSVVEGFYKNLKKGNVPGNLKYNRILNLNLSQLVSLGTKGLEEFSNCLKEFSTLHNTVLFIDNLHILYSYEGLDFVSILTPYLEDPKLKIIATTDKKTFLTKINKENSFETLFTMIKIEELRDNELFEFLTILNWDLSPKLSIPAILFLSKSSQEIMFDLFNPLKSIKIIDEAAKNLQPGEIFINKKDISTVVKNLTGISLGDISNTEKKELSFLKEKISTEVIGQREAVNAISDALIRSGALRDRNSNKPIASFLFAGPTGVGKTELAKSLSRNYFKGEKDIIRLDMSEYQTPESISRLIGSEDGTKIGLLTQAVKDTPFNLILLDELEKASSNIHMLFLQVLDDGRLTDSGGVTVSFKNIILIATTNAGTSEVVGDILEGRDYEDIKERFIKRVKGIFPPEFLNRFTDIILFNPLSKDIFSEILEIKLRKIQNQFYNSHKLKVKLEPELKKYLIEQGYSPEWGARSLERVLEKTVITSISKAIISDNVVQGQEIFIDKNFVLKYSKM